MAASGSQLRSMRLGKSIQSGSKDSIEEAMPVSLVVPSDRDRIFPSDIVDLLHDYAFENDLYNSKSEERKEKTHKEKEKQVSMWLKRTDTLYRFFGTLSSKKQILSLAEYAGPFDLIEAYVREAHAMQDQNLDATLMLAINQAVTGLDYTLRDKEGRELYKGMAERLLEFHAEIFPDQRKVLVQARRAAPFQDEKAKQTREEANIEAMNQLFKAFVRYDEALPAAIATFKKFVKNSKPRVMQDNRYHLNLIHCIFAAFDILAKRGHELPRLNGEAHGQWWDGYLARTFCLKIIGAIIQSDLPSRMRQVLRHGLYYLFNPKVLIDGSCLRNELLRDVDPSGALFRGDGTDLRLGITSYYGAYGLTSSVCHRANPTARPFAIEAELYKACYERLSRHPQFIIQLPEASLSQCVVS